MKEKNSPPNFFYSFIPIFIFLSIFIPNKEGVVAQIFAKDCFHHFDTFVASPAWAFAKGNILNIDTNTQYGMFMPVIIASLSKMMGGVTYENILSSLILLTILYMILCYAFLEVWLKNTALAVIGILLILKFQMFNSGSADPIIWRYPGSSAVRYFFDIPFFILIWQHLKSRVSSFLALAAMVSGVALAYITGTGLCVVIAYYGYLTLLFLLPGAKSEFLKNKSIFLKSALFLFPILSFLITIGIFAGARIFTKEFWFNFIDYMGLTKGGLGALPLSIFLTEGKALNVVMAGVMCVTYFLTVLFIASAVYRKKITPVHLLSVVIALYGIGSLHYYLGRSSPENVPVICIPFILLACYWLNIFYMNKKEWLYLMAVLICGVALWTTPAFMSYPNYFHGVRISSADDIKVMKEDFVTSKDIDLITQLTALDEKVCLMSNQETKILMKAGRRPFFYYLPFTFSRTFRIMQFGGSALVTKERVNQELARLEEQRPAYVFIEKQFMVLPKIYYMKFEALTALVGYIHNHYEIAQSGDYLMALKRKD